MVLGHADQPLEILTGHYDTGLIMEVENDIHIRQILYELLHHARCSLSLPIASLAAAVGQSDLTTTDQNPHHLVIKP